jgi:hypothetical protein
MSVEAGNQEEIQKLSADKCPVNQTLLGRHHKMQLIPTAHCACTPKNQASNKQMRFL